MYDEERTKSLFEKIDGYPKASQLPSSAFNYYHELNDFEFINRVIFRTFFFLSGFKSFNKGLRGNLENLSRNIDLRSGALFAPLISATIVLKDNKDLDPIHKAAALIISAKKFYENIRTANVDPDTYKGQALEMGQYLNLFATTQIIEGGKARIFKSKFIPQITIVSKGYFYILDLANLSDEIRLKQITTSLNAIIEDSKLSDKKNDYCSPGIITASNNPTQLREFKKIKKNKKNLLALNHIKRSLFTLCLDLETFPSSYEESAKKAHIENLDNRWFHSSLQIIVFGNAKTSLIINFSNYVSGNNMMRAASEIQKGALLIDANEQHVVKNVPELNFTKLNWVIDPLSREKAKLVIEKFIDNQDSTFTISNIGDNDFKKYGVKTIPTFILALQLTAESFIEGHPKITQFLTMSKYCCMDLLATNITTDKVKKLTEFVKGEDFDFYESKLLLNDAILSQEEKIRNQRAFYPLNEQISLFIASRKGVEKFYVIFLNIIRMILLSFTGFIKSKSREIIVSHPKIYDEVEIVGRPGIKIPYAKYFGLHYQIFKNKILITMMPGLKWRVTNQDFINELEKNLKKIISILKKN